MLGVREEKIHQLIWRVFTKTNGLTLKAEAVEYLKERLGPNSLSEPELLNALTCIAQEYKRTLSRPALVDTISLAAVIEGMIKVSVSEGPNQQVPARNFIHAVNAQECPRWDYHGQQKLFHQVSDEAWSTIGGTVTKIEMYQRHFEIVKQRVLRSEGFSGPNGARVSLF